MVRNGIIIQEIGEINTHLMQNALYRRYNGVHKFHSFTLTDKRDRERIEENRKLQKEYFSTETPDHMFVINEFIHDMDLAKRYLKRFVYHNLRPRILFAESTYEEETWKDELPDMKFIGYEVFEISLDCYNIWDFLHQEYFTEFYKKLNKNGLFKTYEDAEEYMNFYLDLLNREIVGDGEADMYVFKLSIVKPESILSLA